MTLGPANPHCILAVTGYDWHAADPTLVQRGEVGSGKKLTFVAEPAHTKHALAIDLRHPGEHISTIYPGQSRSADGAAGVQHDR